MAESCTPGSLPADGAPTTANLSKQDESRGSPDPGDAGSWPRRHVAGVTDPVLPINVACWCRIV
jgi:hypothetical protein